MSFKNSGLRRLQENLEVLSSKHEVPLVELLSPEFMRQTTRFNSFQAMLEASPFTVRSAEDFRAIPDEDWEAFVRSATTFPSWESMQKEAGVQWVKAQLLKGIK